MCGILAQLGHDDRFFQAAELVKHRGTRTTTLATSAGAVAHARLPIVGVGRENDQPVSFVDGSALAFVGEILDFRERDPKADCDLRAVCDTWRAEGPEGFRKFDGFWSVVVLKSNTLYGLCDYLAQKPLYYRADVSAISSELDPLAALAPVTPDKVYLSAVVKWGYYPTGTRTPYAEIFKVPAGTMVKISSSGRVSLELVDSLTPTTVNPEELKHMIVDAAARRAESSDVPVATLVSGGLDSSIVYHLASRYADVQPYYVGEGFDPDEAYERARSLAGSRGVSRHIWGDVSTEEALRYMQEPVDLGSLRPQVALSKVVEESVCLTGDGADELFGGYGRAGRYDSQQSDVYHELVNWHLPRLDRVMMRNRVEVRSPFLARRVVEAALGIPRWQRTYKKILRDLFRSELGSLVDVPKEPLRTPEVERDREGETLKLIKEFMRRWPSEKF